MIVHDVRSCFQLLLFLCVALGQQSKIARNSVVEEVVWTVLLCISESSFASRVEGVSHAYRISELALKLRYVVANPFPLMLCLSGSLLFLRLAIEVETRFGI